MKLLDQDAAHFYDNRLGFEINASYIVHVFTANDKDKICAPLLDRCDVVEVPPPSKSDIESILRGAIIPQALKKVNDGVEVSFSEEAVTFVLRELWAGDRTSIRQYQALVSNCVRVANFDGVCTQQPIVIGALDAEKQLKKLIVGSERGRIGF